MARSLFSRRLEGRGRDDTNGFEMNGDRVGRIACIATTHGNRHRQIALAAGVYHQPVASGQPCAGKGQAPEAVPVVGVGAGQVDGQVKRPRRQ